MTMNHRGSRLPSLLPEGTPSSAIIGPVTNKYPSTGKNLGAGKSVLRNERPCPGTSGTGYYHHLEQGEQRTSALHVSHRK